VPFDEAYLDLLVKYMLLIMANFSKKISNILIPGDLIDQKVSGEFVQQLNSPKNRP
jgi:hypothetical protein